MSIAPVPHYAQPSAAMQALDRCGWTAGIAFASHGVRIGVRTNEPAALDRVRECLPPGWQPLPSPEVDYLLSLWLGGTGKRPGLWRDSVLYGESRLLGHSLDPGPLYEELEGDVHLQVAYFAEDRVFIHAGVVGWQGKAIVIPGLSRSGKSTLVAELVRSGAAYYSDEYAVLDEYGYVHPYPRRLSLRQPAGKPRRCRAEELGGCAGVEPLPVGVVAVTTYRPGARWQPRPLSPGKATLELMFHAVPAERKPETVLRVLGAVTPQARKLGGLRGEAQEAAEMLLREAG